MTRRTILLALVLTIVIVIGALCVGTPGIGWYSYRIMYRVGPGSPVSSWSFYSPVALPPERVLWLIMKVKRPQSGGGAGIEYHDCLQEFGWHLPKGWKTDR